MNRIDLQFRAWLEDTNLYAGEPPISWRLPPDVRLGKLASAYMKKSRLDPKSMDITYDPLDPSISRKIADFYEKAQHNPNDPAVKRAYDAFKRETLQQFEMLLKAGYKFLPDADAIGEKQTDQGGGYPGAKEMRDDVLKNRRLYTYIGGDLPPDHPLGELTPYEFGGHRLTYNDVFRFVHDIFGHAHHGNHFSPRGEEHAYRMHSRMYSPEARAAMAAETRGQNSWVHFGPHGHKPVEDRPYAQQKATILPQHLLGDIHPQRLSSHQP